MITKENLIELQKMYKTDAAIGFILGGFSRQYIQHLRKKYDIKKYIDTNIIGLLIASDYKAGQKISTISKNTGYSKLNIYRYLKKFKIKLRDDRKKHVHKQKNN